MNGWPTKSGIEIEFDSYFNTMVPSYVSLGIDFSWGMLTFNLIKFSVTVYWGKRPMNYGEAVDYWFENPVSVPENDNLKGSV